MQKNNLYILILILTLIAQPKNTYSQTLHAILFAATEDTKIGKGNARSAEMISNELRRMGISLPSLEVELYPFYGQSCSPQSLENILLEFQEKDLEDDVIFFAFMGHGYNDPLSFTEWPHMLLMNTDGPITEEALNQNAYPLHLLVDRFENLGPRLLISYVEACNNFVDTDNPAFRIPEELFVPAPPEVIKTDRYEDLFLRSAGTVVFTSSSKEEASYVSNLEGGIFTQAFIKALHKEVTRTADQPASFQSLFQHLKRETRSICDRTNKKQNPQFAEFPSRAVAYSFQEAGKNSVKGLSTSPFTPNVVKKNMEEALATPNLEQLKIEISPTEDGDKEKNKILKKTPLMYYTSQALYHESQQDSAQALIFYQVAHHLLFREKLFTKEDLALMQSLPNEDVHQLTGIHAFKDFYDWLQFKSGLYEDAFSERITKAERIIKGQEKEIEYLKRSIQEDRMQINYFLQEQAKMEEKIKAIDIKREQIANIELPNFQKISTSELTELATLFEKVQAGVNLEDQQMQTIGDNTVEFQFVKRNADSNLQPSGKGFNLGNHCNTDIQNTTQDLMHILLASIDRVPTDQKQQIQINIQLTGHADWQGGQGLLGIKYQATEDLKEIYKTSSGDERRFSMKAGQIKAISNEELAFLRAYCVYQTLETLLLDKGLAPSQISVDFLAIAHAKPPSLAQKDDPGSDYRGFDLNLSLKNVYRHYINKIIDLEERIDLMDQERENYQVAIQSKREQIEPIEIRVHKTENQKQQLEQITKDADARQLYTRAQEEVAQTLSLWR